MTGAVDWTDQAHRQVSYVSQVRVDPLYDPSASTSDAALLVLSAPTTAPPIQLASTNNLALEQGGTSAYIAGWGETYGGDLTTTLQFAPTVVQSADYCGQVDTSPFTNNPLVQLCALDYPADDTTTCSGDSGGPLVAFDVQSHAIEIGLTSFGPQDCPTDSPSFFTKVSPVYPWAQGVIRSVAPPSPPPPPRPSVTSKVLLSVPGYVRHKKAYPITLRGSAAASERLYLFVDSQGCGATPSVEHNRANGVIWYVTGGFTRVSRWRASAKGIDHACGYLQRSTEPLNSSGGIVAHGVISYRVH